MVASRIILLIAFFFIQTAFAQPVEYRGRASWYDRITGYHQQPNFVVRYPSSKMMGPKISLSKKLPYINSVFIRGGVNMQLIGSYGENRIKLKAYYPGLSVKVYRGAIYISYSKPFGSNQNIRPSLKLYLNQIQQLTISGDSMITGHHLNTDCGLAVTNCGNGSLCLTGPLNIVCIENTGNGILCFRGVCSCRLHILATRCGVVHLEGTTGLLLVRAFQQATVDGRFMCSDTAMVQAQDSSLVTVRTYGSLRAFASGMSNIYYYVKPGELLQHNVLSGNVLQMVQLGIADNSNSFLSD